MILVISANLKRSISFGQTPKSDIPPNVAPKFVASEIYLQICDSFAMLIGEVVIVTLFGAMLGGIPLSGAYRFIFFFCIIFSFFDQYD